MMGRLMPVNCPMTSLLMKKAMLGKVMVICTLPRDEVFRSAWNAMITVSAGLCIGSPAIRNFW